MKYNIYITKTAEHDLEAAANYIDFILKNPAVADDLYDLFEKNVLPLSTNPKTHPVVEDPTLNSLGIRFVKVGNYLAFYTINDITHTVYIIRFLYEKRVWRNLLKKSQ